MSQSDDAIDDLMSGLRAQLPGADDPVIFYTMRDVIRQLCRRGRVWRVEGQIPALRNIGALRVSGISGFGEPVWVESVSFRGRHLPYGGFNTRMSTPTAGVPTEWAFEAPDRIFLNPILETAEPGDSFWVKAAVQPRLGVDPSVALSHVPAHIFAQYQEIIAQGTLGFMMVMPGKPWSNGALSATYIRRFLGLVAAARVTSDNNRGTDPRPRWRFPAPAARRY
jgi:hypothetical protein